MSEVLEIVDADNQPLGVVRPRQQVHAQQLWHRTVHIYIVNRKGHMLVHTRSLGKDVSPGLLDARVGGHVYAGQTVLEGVAAELAEEVGIEVDFSHLTEGMVYQSPKQKQHKQFGYVFYYAFKGVIDDFRFVDGEVTAARFMHPLRIALSMLLTPHKWSGGGFMHFLQVYFEYVLAKLRKPQAGVLEDIAK